MRNIKSLSAVFLAVFVLAMIPMQAFAVEADAEAIAEHTHQWYFDHYATGYVPIDDETHMKSRHPVYYCSVSGCNEFDMRDGSPSTESHSMSSYSYTGSNYHEGNYHYIRYERSCHQCGHSDGYWDPYRCPGNGHCILPQSVFPVPADK